MARCCFSQIGCGSASPSAERRRVRLHRRQGVGFLGSIQGKAPASAPAPTSSRRSASLPPRPSESRKTQTSAVDVDLGDSADLERVARLQGLARRPRVVLRLRLRRPLLAVGLRAARGDSRLHSLAIGRSAHASSRRIPAVGRSERRAHPESSDRAFGLPGSGYGPLSRHPPESSVPRGASSLPQRFAPRSRRRRGLMADSGANLAGSSSDMPLVQRELLLEASLFVCGGFLRPPVCSIAAAAVNQRARTWHGSCHR